MVKKLSLFFSVLLVFLIMACNNTPVDLISNIEITNLDELQSKVYFVGDEYEQDTVHLLIYYANGSSIMRDSSSDSSIIIDSSNVNMSEPGVYTIKVSYEAAEINASYTITVQENTIKSIRIKQNPDKLEYSSSEPVSLNGLILEVEWKNGTVEEVAYNEENASLFTTNPTYVNSTGSITIYYGGCNTRFNVSYNPILEIVEIVSYPNKKIYYKEEPVNLEGLKVREIYSDGNYHEIEWENGTEEYFVTSPESVSKTQSITITYKNKYNFTFDVEFTPVSEDITIKTLPTKLKYEKEEKVDLSGLVLEEHYSDGSSSLIEYSNDNASDFTVSPEIITESTTVNVTYNGQTVIYDVKYEPVITAVRIKNNPSLMTYLKESAVDLTGFSVSIEWSDGSITEDSYNDSPELFTIISPSVINRDNTSVVVSYKGFELVEIA